MSVKRKIEATYWEKLRLEEGWFSFFALLLALMTVVWSIEGGRWVEGSHLLPWAALAGFLIGFGLARVRFVPALLAHSFMASVGMVLMGLLVSPFAEARYTEWSQRLGSVVLRVARWSENAVMGNARDDRLVFLALLCFGVWTLGYTAAWLLFRGRQVWWALSTLGIALMVNLSFNPPNAVFSFTFFLLVGMLLVVRFQAFMDEERWRSLRMYFQPGTWRATLAVGACLALAVIALAFATPSQSQYDGLGRVLDSVSQPFSDVRGIWDNVGAGGSDRDRLAPRSRANYNSLDDSFTIGGPLRLSNDPYFRVTGDAASPPIYMQAKAMDEYDGKGWLNTYQTVNDPKDDKAMFRRLSLAANQSLPTPVDKGRSGQRMTLTSIAPGLNSVLTLGDLVSVDRPSLVAFHYEKTTINALLDSLRLKDMADGNGGRRTMLVDDTTGKPVPPAALDLVKYLKEGSRLAELAVPPTMTFTYVRSTNYSNIEYRNAQGRLVQQSLRSGASQVALNSGFSYRLPGADALRALNLQPGASPAVNRLQGVQVSLQTSPGRTLEVNSSVYLSANGDYVVTLESPYARGNTARERFEATPTGQQVLAEIKKLQDAVKGNKVSYTLTNGRPAGLQYEGYEPNYDDLTGAVLPNALAQGESYTTQARRYRADVQTLQRSSTQYPDWVKDRYLKLPASFSPGMRALAEELAAGAATPYDKAKAIEDYLNSLNYTIDPPAVPEGRDEIDYFLFETRSGYCVHFSSAMVLLLRSQGVPARLVTGFIGGEFEPETGSWLVRGSAAHAWPQVYFTGIGWVDFEPTPGREGIQRPPDPASIPPQPLTTPPPTALTPAPASPTTPASQAPDRDPDPVNKNRNPETGQPETPAATPEPPKEIPAWLLWVGGLSLAAAGLFTARRMYYRRLFGLPDPSPLVVYTRLVSGARRSGLRARNGMTPNEYAAFLASRVPEAARAVTEITNSYVRRRYGPAVEDTEDEQRRRHREAAATAERKLREIEASGRQPRPEELWEVFRTSTEVHNDGRAMRDWWQTYQEALLRYRRQRRRDRLTPDFLRKLQTRLRKANG